jgi:hypothetical protein
MRTTLTLDPDVTRLLDQEVHRLRKPLKQVVNEALRRGLTTAEPAGPEKAFTVIPHRARLHPGLDRFALNRLADELEDEAVLAQRKPSSARRSRSRRR